ncbi:MAG TPA: hypothetical protein VK674_07230 [Candidatus Limnocylindria bacterium]|nr:hypothetical protein [Candidatus Limnocylindria bacterium]
MLLRLFAHNGIDHATHMEAAAHQSNPTLVWVTVVVGITAALVYTIKRSRGSRQAEEVEEDEE